MSDLTHSLYPPVVVGAESVGRNGRRRFRLVHTHNLVAESAAVETMHDKQSRGYRTGATEAGSMVGSLCKAAG